MQLKCNNSEWFAGEEKAEGPMICVKCEKYFIIFITIFYHIDTTVLHGLDHDK